MPLGLKRLVPGAGPAASIRPVRVVYQDHVCGVRERVRGCHRLGMDSKRISIANR